MSINFNNNCFKLDTRSTTYCLKIANQGYVMHTYYGGFISDTDVDYLQPKMDRAFAPVPPNRETAPFSLDTAMQEFTGSGSSDFRINSAEINFDNGSRIFDLHYFSHSITAGTIKLEGMPCARGDENGTQTLKLTLKDSGSELYVNIYYTVFEKQDVIVRWAEFENKSDECVFIDKAMSMQLDLLDKEYDFISFYGTWAKERQVERRPLAHGTQGFFSRRGTSSHQQSPFFALCRHDSNEAQGDAYGFHLVYSGNHKTTIEVTQFDLVRCVMGINDEGFRWKLSSGDKFTTPQVLMSFSSSGIGGMSQNFHGFIREHICNPKWLNVRRPILINNWEATYFDFNETKLLNIAKTAKDLGVEMLVMDDGWFGHRNDDTTSLGDWKPFAEKLPEGLGSLVQKINDIGMKFGLWFEPEMISEDSDLYRAHPDWCFQAPNKSKSTGRNQLVLDFSREEIRECIFEQLKEILCSANIEYIKWDMNRHLTEVFSIGCPADRQGELYHRYVLGVYNLFEKITTEFPDLLIENCSGGGGRFDTGMLYYSPQIWTSDDSDAVERVFIQYGTSFGFPVSTMGSHVSAVPNHQVGRVTSLQTRGAVASCGTFGYELDLNTLTDEEKTIVKEQCEFYKKHYNLINNGNFKRLVSPFGGKCAAWAFVSEDKSEVMFFHIKLYGEANGPFCTVRIPDLAPDKKYYDDVSGKCYFGNTLSNAGINVPYSTTDAKVYVTYLHA